MSPKFAVKVGRWIHHILKGDQVSLNNDVDFDYKMKQLALEEKKLEKEIEVERFCRHERSLAIVERLSGGRLEDTHATFFKELFLNLTKNVEQPSSNQLLLKGEQLTLSIVASEKGLRLSTSDLIRVGKTLAQNYEKKYGKKPEKHTQMHHGRMIPVNSYYECDRALIEETLVECFN